MNNTHVGRSGARFVISLDFELHWGIRDITSLDAVRSQLLRTRQAIPVILDLFEEFGVHATWATVGFLFAESRDELLHYAPEERAHYPSPVHDPYAEPLGEGERDDPFHFAASLVERIAATPHQELGTHTFSHYYTLAPWADASTFAADLAAAKAIAAARGITLRSIVLPRNQLSPMSAQVIGQAGLTAFRGNPNLWEWRQRTDQWSPAQRGVRLLDAYVPLRRPLGDPTRSTPDDVAATRFLRPVAKRERGLWRLRVQRILWEMTDAAQRGVGYHLWWHPHNFGANLALNMRALRRVLAHRQVLDERFGMPSMTMHEAASAS